MAIPSYRERNTCQKKLFGLQVEYTVETELKVTQSALDVHMGCTPFVKD